MKKLVAVVAVFASSLSATPLTTFVEGIGAPSTNSFIDFSGAGVSLEAGGDTGSYDYYLCRIDRTCQVQDYISGANLYYLDPEPGTPYICATYDGFELGLREPASLEIYFTWSRFFGLDTKTGSTSVPITLWGQIQLGQPGTGRYLDLRLHGSGTAVVYLDYVPDLTGAPPWAIDVVPPMLITPGQITFSGELTEAPEPFTAGTAMAGILAAALAAKRRRSWRVN